MWMEVVTEVGARLTDDSVKEVGFVGVDCCEIGY